MKVIKKKQNISSASYSYCLFIFSVLILIAFSPECYSQNSDDYAPSYITSQTSYEPYTPTYTPPPTYKPYTPSYNTINNQTCNFDFGSNIKQQLSDAYTKIREWELNRNVGISNRCMSNLPNMNDAWTSVAGSFATPSNPASTIVSSGVTFLETVDRMATSMQIMNPPTYLNEKTSWGCKGEGSMPGGYYQENLVTGEPGYITRTHTDWINTDFGIYERNVEIITPTVGSFERFIIHHYPVGNYWDSNTSTMTTTTRPLSSHQVIETSGINDIQSFQQLWNLPSINTTTTYDNFNSFNSYNSYTPSTTHYDSFNSFNSYTPTPTYTPPIQTYTPPPIYNP